MSCHTDSTTQYDLAWHATTGHAILSDLWIIRSIGYLDDDDDDMINILQHSMQWRSVI